MKLNVFLLLYVTGLPTISVSVLRTVTHNYELVTSAMTWSTAKQYCRLTYTDLATIQSDTDWLRLTYIITTNVQKSWSLWAGLYKEIDTWRWTFNSLSLKHVPYSNWYPGQPDNYHGQEMCGIIAAYEKWYDVQCTLVRPFICYNANFSGAARFIGISSPQLIWSDAQVYCRTHHTDLASSLNSSDDVILEQIKINQGDSWIGLHRDPDTWMWSDGTITSKVPWAPGQPDNYYGSETCAYIYNRQYYDYPCNVNLYFLCHTICPVMSQRVRLQVKSDGSVYDPAVQSSILQQVQQTLEENGKLNITVTWKLQPDGNIFYKKKKDEL